MNRSARPLRFDVSVLRSSDIDAEDEYVRVSNLDVGEARRNELLLRWSIWHLAVSLMSHRSIERRTARCAVLRLRWAWEAHCRGDSDRARMWIADAAHSVTWLRGYRWELKDERRREQSREAANAPRNDVSNEEIVAHRTRYIEERGGPYGWVKRAVIDFHGRISERALRERRKKMRQ